MSSFDASMEPMLDMFIYETTTLLEQLDEILLESEKSHNLSEDSINEIFRIMHTIKGSSAMMGIESISGLAHAVEDVFFIIRENPQKLSLVFDAVFDLVFQASDFLKSEIEAVQSGDFTPSDSQPIIAQLEMQADIMNGKAEPVAAHAVAAPAPTPATPVAAASVAVAAPVATAPAAAELAPAQGGIQQIRVFFEDGCQMENIRAFMLITQLKEWCEYIDSIPQNPESDSSLSNEIIKNGFIVRFKPLTTTEDVCKVIENAVNVKSYEILHGDSTATDAAGTSRVAVQNNAQAGASGNSAAETATHVKVSKQSLISVNQSKLDQLMDLVGELVTTESMVSSSPDLKGLVLDNFYKSTREMRKLTDELQDVVMSIRMVPLSGVFQKMNRIVRDMGKKLDKQVELVTEGGDTEVDKTINDLITDPFMHMIRNSMDHAFETPQERRALGKPEFGTLTLAAHNIGGEIVITISDDGRGLDRNKLLAKARRNGLLTKPESEYSEKEIFNLIMLPGFSTNDEVTEYSGRGVGMDVVRKNIEKAGGNISVDSVPGQGTTFTIKIPLTIAIVDGMEISVGDTIFTIPITSIRQSFKITDENEIIHNTDGSEMYMVRGECLPLIRLHQLFELPTEITSITEGIVIQIENNEKSACIFADELLGEQQVVVKPFPAFLSRYNMNSRGISGCTILGDGSISLILDANGLMSNSFER